MKLDILISEIIYAKIFLHYSKIFNYSQLLTIFLFIDNYPNNKERQSAIFFDN